MNCGGVQRAKISKVCCYGTSLESLCTLPNLPEMLNKWLNNCPTRYHISDSSSCSIRIESDTLQLVFRIPLLTASGATHQSVGNGEGWDTDRDVVRPVDSNMSPLRSGEEEAELEMDHSHIASGSEEEQYASGSHPLAPYSRRGAGSYRPTRRAVSPTDLSSQSHVSGDPTLIWSWTTVTENQYGETG